MCTTTTMIFSQTKKKLGKYTMYKLLSFATLMLLTQKKPSVFATRVEFRDSFYLSGFHNRVKNSPSMSHLIFRKKIL